MKAIEKQSKLTKVKYYYENDFSKPIVVTPSGHEVIAKNKKTAIALMEAIYAYNKGSVDIAQKMLNRIKPDLQVKD